MSPLWQHFQSNAPRHSIKNCFVRLVQPQSLLQRARAVQSNQKLERASVWRIRDSKRVRCRRASSCSQMWSTRQPRFRSDLLTSRSRSAFRLILRVQKATRDFGVRPCSGQPCQKQPSTNTATFPVRNTKSGFPKSETPRLQPVIRCLRRIAASRSSVARFPQDRTRDIRLERSLAVSVSATTSSSADTF